VISEQGGMLSHGAMLASALGVPVVVGLDVHVHIDGGQFGWIHGAHGWEYLGSRGGTWFRKL
jgi:phosphohistidine swiveling domain-containing protein